VLEGLRLLEEREEEYQEKVEWLREAAKKGSDQVDRGEGAEFESTEEFEVRVDRIAEEVRNDLAEGNVELKVRRCRNLRHFLLYRVRQDGIIEVARILPRYPRSCAPPPETYQTKDS
jgi:hypothetical protein